MLLKLRFGLLALWLASAGVFAQSTIIDTLENRRSEIAFPELTSDQKRILAEQANLFIEDLYVHRFDKLAFYPGLEDPVPQIQAIVENADSLSTEEIEEGIYRIFVAQRDLHLNYLFPPPHASYRSFLPMTFTRTANFFDRFEVRISAVSADLFAQHAPGQQVPELGDRVIAYDGLPIDDAVERQIQTAQGANEFGGFSRAIGQMTFVPHRLHLKPEQDTISITLEKSSRFPYLHGERYTITLPWLVEFTPPAAAAATSQFRQLDGDTKLDPSRFEDAREIWQEEYNSFVQSVGLTEDSDYPSLPTAEPTLTWGEIENRYGKFGYLRLSSFVPQALGTPGTIAEIRRLLLEELNDTDGLIFDVRNNGGGSILLADALSQLFMRDEADVVKARLLNTELNLSIFNDNVFGPNVLGEQWNRVINDAAGTGERYTELAAFTTEAGANAIGQAYFKPVAVLANARSYSASDLFVCSMKDNGAALVFGEDLRTGAGGANVITHDLFNLLLPSVFEPLPPGHGMRVSWRQSVRFGPSEGKLIEDFGCEANIDVSRTPRDVLENDRDQIRTITRKLAFKSKFFRFKPSVRAENTRLDQLLFGDAPMLNVSVKYTPLISVSVNGEETDLIPVFAFNREEDVEIDLSELPINAQSQVVLRGLSWSGKTLWNFKRNITRLGEKITVDDSGLQLDFSTAPDLRPLAVINSNTSPENGWQLVPPALQVGFTPNYDNNVNTSGILALDLSALSDVSLGLDFEHDTEFNFDFFQVFVADENGVPQQVLQNSSGLIPRSVIDYDLSAFAGQETVLLYFRFISDTSVIAPGVKIYSVTLSAGSPVEIE